MQKRVIFSMTCGSLRKTGCAASALAFVFLSAAPVQAQQLWSKTIALSSAEAASYAPPPQNTASFEAEMVGEVLSAANRARAQHGLGALTRDASLDSVAAAYSRKMLSESFFGHVAPDGSNLDQRLAPHLSRIGRAAENLWTARGKIDWRPSGVSQQSVDNWLDSPGHRRNLLDGGFSTAGVGVAQRGDAIYVTMLYAAPKSGGQMMVASAAAPAPTAPAGFGSNFEAAALRAINAMRARNGLSQLNADQRLSGFARTRSQEMGRNAGLNADGGLLGQVGSSTGARRVAATVWKGDNVQWSAEDLAQTMMDTWGRDSSNMQALLDATYAQVGLGVEVVEGGVRLAAIFTDAAGGSSSGFASAPSAVQPVSGYASAAPVYNAAPVQVAQIDYDLQTGSIGRLSAPTHQSVSLPIYEPGDAGLSASRAVMTPVYDPAPVRTAFVSAPTYNPAPVSSPAPRPSPVYDPSPVLTAQAVSAPTYNPAPMLVSVERRLEEPVDSGRSGWTRRVTTIVTASGGLGGLGSGRLFSSLN